MSQRYDGDGYISDSVGPVTVYQTIVGVGGLGGAAAALYRYQPPGAGDRPHRLALRLGSTVRTSPQTVAPSPTPEGSPH